ncbi:MAG: hypothetical protein IT331_23870 [Anaerolineae bacterium]|nr:hypothetical protein [Anaerolineae bacterium]
MNTRDYHSLAFHPNNPDVLYFGHHGGMMQSSDGGKSWIPLASLQQDAMSIAIPRDDPNVITIAGHDVLSQSNDGGKTWRPLTTNLPGTDIHAFAVNPTNAREFYAFVAGFGLFKSDDGGAMWTSLNRAVPPSTTSIAIRADAPQTIFLGSGQQGLFESGDGGVTWTGIPSNTFQSAIALALNNQNELFVATELGVFKSADSGATWTRLNVDTDVALALAISPSNPQRLAVVNDKGQVFRSDDGGATWGQ